MATDSNRERNFTYKVVNNNNNNNNNKKLIYI